MSHWSSAEIVGHMQPCSTALGVRGLMGVSVFLDAGAAGDCVPAAACSGHRTGVWVHRIPEVDPGR